MQTSTSELVLSREEEVHHAIRMAFEKGEAAKHAIEQAREAACFAGQMLLELKVEELQPAKVTIGDWLTEHFGSRAAKIAKSWVSLPSHELTLRQEVMSLGIVPELPKRQADDAGIGILVTANYLKPLNALLKALRDEGRNGWSERHRIDLRELRGVIEEVYHG